jgi:hypothetical protein
MEDEKFNVVEAPLDIALECYRIFAATAYWWSLGTDGAVDFTSPTTHDGPRPSSNLKEQTARKTACGIRNRGACQAFACVKCQAADVKG